jgi:type II secretory pathway pseudopilin PulG
MMGGLFHSNVMRGQTLVEALIALAVGAIVISAAAILTQNSLNSAQTSKNQNLATQYAQEGIELARKDRNPPTSGSRRYCVAGDATELGTSSATCTSANIGSEYKREVVVSAVNSAGACGADAYEVRSVVSWNEGRCSTAFCRNVELVTCLAP